VVIRLCLNKGQIMSEEKKQRGRPTAGKGTGKRINIYFTEPREALYTRAFNLLKEKGKLPSTSDHNRSRTDVIDYALDALIRELESEK
jgi:hypothetical protein